MASTLQRLSKFTLNTRLLPFHPFLQLNSKHHQQNSDNRHEHHHHIHHHHNHLHYCRVERMPQIWERFSDVLYLPPTPQVHHTSSLLPLVFQLVPPTRLRFPSLSSYFPRLSVQRKFYSEIMCTSERTPRFFSP